MIIYDVDSSLTANELKENMKQQNLDELSIEEENIVPTFKTAPRDKTTVHWVINGS
jgi:iron only hydrogenase large subunit-like protein